MNSTLMQWITDNARYRVDKPLRLDLIFTKGINFEKKLHYECPCGSSDHVVLDIEIKRDMEVMQEKSYQKKRSNNGKTNYNTK